MLWFVPMSAYYDVETRHPFIWAFMTDMNGRKIGDYSFPFTPQPSDLVMRKTGHREIDNGVRRNLILEMIEEGIELGWVLDMTANEMMTGPTKMNGVFEIYEDPCLVARFSNDVARFEFALKFEGWEEYELLEKLPPVVRRVRESA